MKINRMVKEIMNKKSNLLKYIKVIFMIVVLMITASSGPSFAGDAKYIILLVADGWGPKAIEATNSYTGITPSYQTTWSKHWMSTFPEGGNYDSAQAWSNFNYSKNNWADSSACATALYTGNKTANARVNVSSDASTRFTSIAEIAKQNGLGVGAVSSVNISHATPGGWMAHNDDRGNTFAIADEGLFGNPNTTGTVATDTKYGGGHGPNDIADVVIGADGLAYVSSQILTKLRNETGQSGKHVLVEKYPGTNSMPNAVDSLMARANDAGTTKLVGLFDHVYQNASGSGYLTENPKLSESTRAALKVLGKNTQGFVLMVEGGAIDWAAHGNDMGKLIGEVKDFDNAVSEVIDWVQKTGYWQGSAHDASWSNTLVIVTGDHDCGYLTKNNGVFANQPLGVINDTTISKEKIVSGTNGRRASWEDTNGNNLIDTGETVYWYWNSGDHTNSLIPLYTKGAGSSLFAQYATGYDSVRGSYLDDTKVFHVMNSSVKQQCTITGSINAIPGQTLYGNPIDLSLITSETNASNVVYTVTTNATCPAQADATLIAKRSSWKYDIENTGTTWMNTSYNDSGWLTGSGLFGSDVKASPDIASSYFSTPISNTKYSMFFRKNFTVCDPSQVTALTLGASYDDGVVVYINGTQVYIDGVTGNPPLWNGSSAGHAAGSGGVPVYQSKDLSALIGLNALKSLLVPGTNVISVGVYNIVSNPASTDIVWDGELKISSAGTVTLFTGNNIQAQSVNTTGWTNGVKTLQVTANDATCGEPLTPVNTTFTFDSSSASSDKLLTSENTPIAVFGPTEGDSGILMQRFRVDSNNIGNGQVVLSLLTLVDDGTSTNISNAKIYISDTSASTLPTGAVLIGSTGVWNGSTTTISLNGGTQGDRTVSNGTPKYIYIVYDIAGGQAWNTVKSRVTALSVAAPDIGAASIGSSNTLTIANCVPTGTISILPGQTLYGNIVDLTSIVNTSNTTSLTYKVEQIVTCDVNPNGTYVEAEKYSGSINKIGTLDFSTSQSGYLGTGYLTTHWFINQGWEPQPGQDCPVGVIGASGKEYQVNFPTSGVYKVWLRAYAPHNCPSNDPNNPDCLIYGPWFNSAYVGLNGACTGAITTDYFYNVWKWTNTKQFVNGQPLGTNTITINEPGTHKLNIWIREAGFGTSAPGFMVDGIYVTKGTETPTDASRGITIDPTTCNPPPLFQGNATQAQTVSTTTWSNGEKRLTVTGNDEVCGDSLTPAVSTFSIDHNNRPASAITSPVNGTTITSVDPNPYTITGTASDDVLVNSIKVSTDGGQTWSNASCPNCPGATVNWTYSWTLPANGNYTLKSKAVDSAGVEQIPGGGVSVAVYRGGPSVSSTNPLNISTAIVADSSVTIFWDREMDCSTITNSSITVSPAITSWTKSSCSGSQAVFAPVGQAVLTAYTITVGTTVKDSALNPMVSPYQFSYTTGEPTPPSSAITNPLHNSKVNSSAPNPYTVSGTASDNNLVSGVEISINGGTWIPVTSCTGCGTANATWTYSWSLPADGTYVLRSRAKDTSNNLETPGAGNTVEVDRTSPSVSNTSPANDETAVDLNKNVRITWNTNVNCATVNTATVISDNPNWALFDCGGNTAFFTSSGQAEYTLYTITVKSGVSGVMNSSGVPMSNDYLFSYRTNKKPVLEIIQPDGTNDSLKAGNTYNITYNLSDPDHLVTAAFFYDTDSSGYDGTPISGSCTTAAEGTGVTCAWDTTGMNTSGMPPKMYYIYGKTNDPLSGEIKTYSSGQITIYPPNEPPTISIAEPNSTDDTVVVGDTFSIKYTLTDPNIDDTVTASFFYDNDNAGYNGTPISGTCASAPEGTNVTCSWNTAGMTPGSYFVYGVTSDSAGSVMAYSSGKITINAINTLPTFSIIEPNGVADAVKPGNPLNIIYDLNDPDEVVTAKFYYDTDTEPLNPPGLMSITECQSAPEGAGATCTWNSTSGITPGMYYIYGTVKDRSNATVSSYSGPFMFDSALPSSGISNPVNAATINSSVPNPYSLSGTATDNVAVQNIQVSTDGGSTWSDAVCSGCPGANVSWSYSWPVPSDGGYTVKSRATDIAGNVEAAGTGNTVTIDRTAPIVSSSVPVNGVVGVDPDSTVTINWNEAIDCATVSTTSVTISPSVGWVRTSCSGSQAVFTPSGQAASTLYTINISTAVTDTAGNLMASPVAVTYTTNVPPALSISRPDGTAGAWTLGNAYEIQYTLNDPDDIVTAAFYYDTDNSGLDGTAIASCASAGEGTDMKCSWDTTGVAPGVYYIYGITSDGSGGSCPSRTWTGSNTDFWAGSNWSPDGLPENGDSLIFDGTSSVDSICVNDISLASFRLNSGYGGTVTMNSTMTVSGDMVIEDGKLVVNGNITVGGSGSCIPQGGSQLSAYSAQILLGTAGIAVSPISGDTSESGGIATFTVVLLSQPTADVTIGLSSSDSTEGDVSPSSLIFTSVNWNIPQTVTVTGQEDAILDGPISYTIMTAAASSDDTNYHGINPDDVIVINTDNDAPSVSIAATTQASEPTTNGQFTVSLSTASATDTV
ncbi:MAG: hypothetical protein C4581_02950, partial [Nitrospiraceae bacterium]